MRKTSCFRGCKMFWRLLLIKLSVDIILLAVLTHEGWSYFTQTRKMLFIWQHGLRYVDV